MGRLISPIRCPGCPINSGLCLPPDYWTECKYKYIFVGDAPDKKDEEDGLPFVGAQGQFLRKQIAALGIKESDYYFTNLLFCRPPRNKIEAVPEAVKLCTCRLRDELDRHAGILTVIIPLGPFAWRAVASIYGLKGHAITKARGSVYNVL